MAKAKKSVKAFKWIPFSEKQLQLLTWWIEGQSPFHQHKIVIADGSIRSGKTVSIIDSFLTWSLANHADEQFIIAGKTMGAIKKNVLPPMFEILTAKGIPYNYNRSENYLEIGTNTYFLYGAPTEASQDVLQGLTAAGALADEVALFPRSFFNQMIGRCSVTGSKVFATCNPKGPYHWLKKEFIDNTEKKNLLHLHFTLDDNPALAEETKQFYKNMYEGVFYQRNILGWWVLSEGLIFDMFDRESMTTTTIPAMKRYWVAGDVGYSNATAFHLMGWGHDNKVHVLAEYYHSGRETKRQKSPEQYAQDLRQWVNTLKDENGHRIKVHRIYLDPAAKGFIQQCYKMKIHRTIAPIHRADNDVLGGIETAASLMTMDALRVHESCENLIKGFSTYVWDEKAQERGEDKPLKQDDDAVDSFRYGVHTPRHLYKHVFEVEGVA